MITYIYVSRPCQQRWPQDDDQSASLAETETLQRLLNGLTWKILKSETIIVSRGWLLMSLVISWLLFSATCRPKFFPQWNISTSQTTWSRHSCSLTVYPADSDAPLSLLLSATRRLTFVVWVKCLPTYWRDRHDILLRRSCLLLVFSNSACNLNFWDFLMMSRQIFSKLTHDVLCYPSVPRHLHESNQLSVDYMKL